MKCDGWRSIPGWGRVQKCGRSPDWERRVTRLLPSGTWDRSPRKAGNPAVQTAAEEGSYGDRVPGAGRGGHQQGEELGGPRLGGLLPTTRRLSPKRVRLGSRPQVRRPLRPVSSPSEGGSGVTPLIGVSRTGRGWDYPRAGRRHLPLRVLIDHDHCLTETLPNPEWHGTQFMQPH